jgi:H/ACA ribonucleoprotein complex subunit 3
MKMHYCRKCRIYTLKETCKRCGSETIKPKPAKFSPPDPYGKYRRKLKMESR